jgi:alpha-1,2-mannosyltransferase
MSPRLLRLAALAANLAAVTFFLLSYHQHGISFGPDRIDLDVYRIGARAWLRGGSLYGRLPPTPAGPKLPFTYPPIAAVLLAPLALVPATVAGTVLTLVTIALAAAVLRLFLRRLALNAAAAGWLLPAALFLEPVRNTLSFGQVNVILMALVAFDSLAVEPPWPRGLLTGLAAAVKLTPALFVLFFLLRRDYRAAAVTALSFAAATGLGFALAGRDSVRYWTSVVFQVGRVGHPDYAANQSLQGVLARAGLSGLALLAAWLVLSLAVLVVAGLGMRRALAAGEPCLALSLNAFAALLISPISWSHHWVWCVPAILTLASLGRRHRSRLAAAVAACGLVVFAAAPQWWFPHGAGRELRWAPWEQAAGSSYVLFAAAVLVLAACGQIRLWRTGGTATILAGVKGEGIRYAQVHGLPR